MPIHFSVVTDLTGPSFELTEALLAAFSQLPEGNFILGQHGQEAVECPTLGSKVLGLYMACLSIWAGHLCAGHNPGEGKWDWWHTFASKPLSSQSQTQCLP